MNRTGLVVLRASLTSLTAVIASTVLAAFAPADWPQWRGPTRDGVAEGFAAPDEWPDALTRKWTLDVGEGHASPVVAAGRAYLLTRQGEVEAASCVNLAKGKTVWRKTYPAPYEVDSAAASHGKGPKSTPVLADGRLFTLGISGILGCWQASDGKLLWRQEYDEEFPQTAPQFGTAMSPLVADGRLIVQVGGQEGGALLALDPATGEVTWRLDQPDGPSYASPILVTLSGVPQIVTQTRTTCVGVALESGKLLWQSPFTTAYEQNSVSPVVWQDLLIFGGYDRETVALRPRRRGGKWEAPQAWAGGDLPLYMSTPVLIGDRLFGMSQRDSGLLFSIDPASGETLWTGDGRTGDNAALVVAGDLILILTTDADLLVLEPRGDELREIARYQVADSPTWAHPVLLQGGVLIKDAQTLALWSWVP